MQYKIIYADPPWQYNDKALAGNRGAECKYPVMSQQELAAMDIQSIADPDCALLMWVTMPKLQDGLNLIKAWGFKYKTCAFTWVKRNTKSSGWFWGMGNFTRANAELCLLAVKGKPKRVSAAVHSVVDTPREIHSKKPECIRDRIVQLFGDVPRLEMFCRGKGAAGWDVFGNEAEDTILIPRHSTNG